MTSGNGWDHMGSWGWAGMTLMMLLWFGIIALIVWAVLSSRSSPTILMTDPASRHDAALEILRERFARGDITAEEYEQSRQILEKR